MAALDELKSTTFDSGEPYLGLILSNRRVRKVNRRMSSWHAFRTRHASYLFAHLIVCVYHGKLRDLLRVRETQEVRGLRYESRAELGTFKIWRYHFDNESFVHPLHSVRFDPDRPYEIPIKALMADKILSASKDEKSPAERSSSFRHPSPHYSPRTMPVAQRERSTSSVKGTRSFRRSTTSSSVRKQRSWELIPPSEGWMCDADDEKEIGGMDPSEKEESSEEDPKIEEEDPEGAGNPEDRVPATLSLPMDIDAKEDFQRYVEELGGAPEPSPLRSSQASAPDEPVEATDRQSASRDGSSHDLSGVWQTQSSSPSS
ncbi:hypothetical protein PIB30_056989 [Stylosanthes scabra]|uniref:Uncharacterized protein n=1 Tax=Stylosanthes scabra TaxID=79078 RepID=A0ABU6UIK6_9FABA|nr:hypothetical protein [Stylosanthes scabra]